MQAGSSKAFSLRDKETDLARLRTSTYASRVNKSNSVFEPSKTCKREKSTTSVGSGRKKQQRRRKKKKKKEDEIKPKTDVEVPDKKTKKKKKKQEIDDESEECLRIEFAELLVEPDNQYCPSLHGWREWKPRRSWIDPDEARLETVAALEEYSKSLPARKTGPPLP